MLVPAVSQFEPGSNRFGFGLFDRTRAQIADAPVGIYVAPEGGGAAHGPFVARYESLEVKPQFQSRSTASDPDAARSLYVARLELPRAGRYDILGVARLDDRLVTATSAGAGLTVRRTGRCPTWATARRRSTPRPPPRWGETSSGSTHASRRPRCTR